MAATAPALVRVRGKCERYPELTEMQAEELFRRRYGSSTAWMNMLDDSTVLSRVVMEIQRAGKRKYAKKKS